MIHLLAIGNNYRGTLSELPDCELDAQNVSEAFQPLCKSVTTLYSKGRAATVKATEKFLGQLKSGDLGILYYSGHGTQTAVGMKMSEALVCNDMRLIYDFELRTYLNQRKPGVMLAMAADACYSGGLTRSATARRAIPASRCIKHRTVRPVRMPKRPNAVYMACAGNETASSTGHGGAWTLVFLDAFANRKASATLASLHKQILKQLPSDSYPQHPQFECDGVLDSKTLKSFKAKAK